MTDALNQGATAWPAELAVAGLLEAGVVLRQLRMAAAWAGPCVLDSYLAGSGTTSRTVRLVGTTGGVELALEVSESGALIRAGISLSSMAG